MGFNCINNFANLLQKQRDGIRREGEKNEGNLGRGKWKHSSINQYKLHETKNLQITAAIYPTYTATILKNRWRAFQKIEAKEDNYS